MDYKNKIIGEKLGQIPELLTEAGIDCWLVFARETAEVSEPALKMLLGADVVGKTALLLTASGKKIAIIGHYDAEIVRKVGEYEVVEYVKGFDEELRKLLFEFDPHNIAVNYSKSDPSADGLTHGMFLVLREYLSGTAYRGRFTSAQPVLNALRGRKTATEKLLIEHAVHTTEELIGELGRAVKCGWSEIDVADFLHQRMKERGVDASWDHDYCPSVHAGPDSPVGHTPPGQYVTKPGHLLHIDYGIKQDGYCSDLQRVWYFPEDQGGEIPAEIEQAFAKVRGAITKAAAVLRSGMKGYEVDAAAREVIAASGYSVFSHALGHQVGRAAHDGGTVLGPRRKNYQGVSEQDVREDEIYTLELGVPTSCGYVGLEEMVCVTKDGCKFISSPQERIWIAEEAK